MPRSFLVKKKERHSGLMEDRVPQVAAIAPHPHGDFHGNVEFASKSRHVDGLDRTHDNWDDACTDRHKSTHQAPIRCQGRIRDVHGRYLDEIALEMQKIECFRDLETEVEWTRNGKRKRSRFIHDSKVVDLREELTRDLTRNAVDEVSLETWQRNEEIQLDGSHPPKLQTLEAPHSCSTLALHQKSVPHQKFVPHQKSAPHPASVPHQSHHTSAPHPTFVPHRTSVPHPASVTHPASVPHPMIYSCSTTQLPPISSIYRPFRLPTDNTAYWIGQFQPAFVFHQPYFNPSAFLLPSMSYHPGFYDAPQSSQSQTAYDNNHAIYPTNAKTTFKRQSFITQDAYCQTHPKLSMDALSCSPSLYANSCSPSQDSSFCSPSLSAPSGSPSPTNFPRFSTPKDFSESNLRIKQDRDGPLPEKDISSFPKINFSIPTILRREDNRSSAAESRSSSSQVSSIMADSTTGVTSDKLFNPITSLRPENPQTNRDKPEAKFFHCETCRKSYATFAGLSKHQKLFCCADANDANEPTKKKKHGCPHCEKVYTSIGALKMHIRTHTLPCHCPVCGKSFSRPWLLQGHLRTHTGEKPFECQKCARAFADRSNLRAHLQTHSEVKKYNCHACAKAFSRMSLLVKHREHCSSSS